MTLKIFKLNLLFHIVLSIYYRISFCFMSSFLFLFHHFSYELSNVMIIEKLQVRRILYKPWRKFNVDCFARKAHYKSFRFGKLLSLLIGLFSKSKLWWYLFRWATNWFSMLFCKTKYFCIHLIFYLNSLGFPICIYCGIY